MDDRYLFAAVLLAGVLVPGLAKRWLTAAGHPDVGTVVWVAGYGLAVAVLWFRWLRPLDPTGPDDGGTEP